MSVCVCACTCIRIPPSRSFQSLCVVHRVPLPCHGTEGVNVPDGGCSISLSLAGKVMGPKPQLTCCGLGA